MVTWLGDCCVWVRSNGMETETESEEESLHEECIVNYLPTYLGKYGWIVLWIHKNNSLMTWFPNSCDPVFTIQHLRSSVYDSVTPILLLVSCFQCLASRVQNSEFRIQNSVSSIQYPVSSREPTSPQPLPNTTKQTSKLSVIPSYTHSLPLTSHLISHLQRSNQKATLPPSNNISKPNLHLLSRDHISMRGRHHLLLGPAPFEFYTF